MRQRTRRAILIVLVAAICLLAAIVALALRTAPTMKPLRITLVSITSNSPKAPLATFSVSNANGRLIHFLPMPPETRTPLGVWPGLSFPSSGAAGLSVEAGQEARFTVVVPTNGATWRQPVLWAIEPNRFERLRLWLQNWRTLQDKGTFSGWAIGFRLNNQTNYSDEIAPQ